MNLTGMMVSHLYYWSTNQVIVQRALAAKSLAQGQKGLLYAAAMKVVGFVFLCIPGIIAMIMVQKGVVVNGKPFVVEKADKVFPLLVNAVMPKWSIGFFAAVLLGSILSTFNSALNSASTLFALEVYKIYINPEATNERVVRISTVFGVAITLLSFALAPLLQNIDSIFEYVQLIRSAAALPIITIFCVALVTAKPDAFAAKFAFCVGLIGVLVLVILEVSVDNTPPFLHIFFIAVLFSSISMMVATYVPGLRACFGQPRVPAEYVATKDLAVVSMAPWTMLWPVVGAIVCLIVLLYVALQVGSSELFHTFWVCWVLGFLALMLLPSEKRRSAKTNAEENNRAPQACVDTDALPRSDLTLEGDVKNEV